MIKKILLFSFLLLSVNLYSADSCKVYTAMIYQNLDNDPYVHVLGNSIGNIKWTRLASGYYKGELENAFILNKTWFSVSSEGHSALIMGNQSEIILITRNYDGIPNDNIISMGASIEIRVYNSF